MNAPQWPAAPASGSDDVPTFAQLAADPEIAALLDFDPVPRRIAVDGGWSPEKQREFIARLALHGSKNKACIEMAMHATGMTKLQNSPGSKSFRAAWEGAVDLARRRRSEKAAAESVAFGSKLPTVDHRRKQRNDGPLPGQVMNERGEWEDESSWRRRGEEAGESIAGKLTRIRRIYLADICNCPGKRAAFEILTELPVDWGRAAKFEPQEFEPYRRPNHRQPDMVLTNESGWTFGEIGYGPDRKAEVRKIMDDHRAEQGLEPIDWDESAED